MTTPTHQDIVDVYVDDFQTNISDVNATRAANSKKWVYDDPPAPNITDTPRLTVLQADGDSVQRWLNSTDEWAHLPVNVQIYVRKGEKHTIGGSKKRDMEIIEHLENAVRDRVKSSAFTTALDTAGVLHAELITESLSYGDLLVKTLTFQNRVNR